MIYPSLLYLDSDDRSGNKIEYSVFSDLKLTAFLSEAVISAVKTPCRADEIILRQNVFKLLENTDFRRHFGVLFRCIDRLDILDDCMNNAKTDIEKQMIFISLADGLLDFFKKAALGVIPEPQTENCVLYCRFKKYFTAENNKNHYKRIAEELRAVLPLNEKIKSNMLKIHGETIKVSQGTPAAYIDKLAECADDLGLPQLNLKITLNKKIAPNIVGAMAGLYPEAAAAFKEFYESYKNYYISDILNYKKEIGFYLEFLNVFDRVKQNGLPLNYPVVTDEKTIRVRDAYDITLLAKNETKIIPNDIDFNTGEPFFYLTGANGGGKTTYLRTVGVTVLMFLNGCPVACQTAEIYPLTGIFTHFPRDERFENTGRFEEEEGRAQEILKNMTDASVVLLNETYSTAAEEDAVALTNKLAVQIYNSGAYGIYITHQHDITGTQIPYLNVVVDKNDKNRRTYKVAKKRNEDGSLAADVLKKYALTKEALYERFMSGGVDFKS